MAAILEARGLGKTYTTGPEPVVALRDFDLAVEPGTLTVIKGRSGSGKTTLLNLLGGLDRPTTGTVLVDGVDIHQLSPGELAELRRSTVGFVFQTFGLLPILTAAENVEVPMRLARADHDLRRSRSTALLEHVGLGGRVKHRPHELSGGEQQRVAIARALANEPKLLLADEPTGQLDSRTGRTIIELIYNVVREDGVAAIVATHDPAPMALADRVIELSNGRAIIPN
ncbi:MAG: ABC transporter ATP-binding protein [Acidimicrobiales bacterium]|jgi:putative ABC transport system ATP-binding protein|nr:ABC transporter ATP-binding protein [Acidimicrobiales bacterium]HLV89574.1 ABC transporter ATP-binding protein [Acidimicrobiia bacterium]